MNLFDLVNENENHPAYQALEIANGGRQYEFLLSMVTASLQMERPFLSEALIKAFNYHAIACLHSYAGEYRPCPVTVGNHTPPAHYRIPALMEDFINAVNRQWSSTDPVVLAAFTLWRMNFVHPFINGNGRTARAASYFVLCVSAGGPLPGTPILPELIKQNRLAYVQALVHADSTARQTGTVDLGPLHTLLAQLIAQQIGSATPAPPNAASSSSPATPPS